MNTKSVALQKSFAFALRIIKLCDYLCEEKRAFVIAKQLLKSGTSVGANLSESDCAMSENDFLAKVYVAYKECSETQYWLELIKEAGYISQEQFNSIYSDCNEITKMLAATTKTLENKKGKK